MRKSKSLLMFNILYFFLELKERQSFQLPDIKVFPNKEFRIFHISFLSVRPVSIFLVGFPFHRYFLELYFSQINMH